MSPRRSGATAGLACPPGARLDTIEDELAAAGRWGRKNGRGWYLYEKDARTGTPDPEVLAAIDAYRRRNGFTPRRISPEEIVERCIYALVNEGAKEIEEGIALRASDIDVAAVYGFGFPRYRGGPMRYAEDIGLKSVAAKIEAFHARLGYWWKPSQLLLDLARQRSQIQRGLAEAISHYFFLRDDALS